MCSGHEAVICSVPCFVCCCFAFTQWLPPSLQHCPLCAHHAVPPSLLPLLPRSVFPSPHLSLGLLFCRCMQHLCPSFRLSHTILFSPSVTLCLSSRRLPPSSFGHMLFISALPCLMPVGSWLGMLGVLLCVSRTHSLSLLQLCGMVAPLTSGSAAVMVI